MRTLNSEQLKLIAQFFSNMAVVWFAAAFIAPKDMIIFMQSVGAGVMSLALGVFLIKEN